MRRPIPAVTPSCPLGPRSARTHWNGRGIGPGVGPAGGRVCACPGSGTWSGSTRWPRELPGRSRLGARPAMVTGDRVLQPRGAWLEERKTSEINTRGSAMPNTTRQCCLAAGDRDRHCQAGQAEAADAQARDGREVPECPPHNGHVAEHHAGGHHDRRRGLPWSPGRSRNHLPGGRRLGPGTAGLPPGYPRECEQEVTLRDGRRVLIRPSCPVTRRNWAKQSRQPIPTRCAAASWARRRG